MKDINKIISDYHNLIALTKSKISEIEKLDFFYNTNRGVEKISFDLKEEIVEVVVDYSYRGCTDYDYFSFPIEWINKEGEELEEVVNLAKIEREELQRKKLEDKVQKDLEAQEKKELEQYNKLKEKFGV